MNVKTKQHAYLVRVRDLSFLYGNGFGYNVNIKSVIAQMNRLNERMILTFFMLPHSHLFDEQSFARSQPLSRQINEATARPAVLNATVSKQTNRYIIYTFKHLNRLPHTTRLVHSCHINININITANVILYGAITITSDHGKLQVIRYDADDLCMYTGHVWRTAKKIAPF